MLTVEKAHLLLTREDGLSESPSHHRVALAAAALADQYVGASKVGAAGQIETDKRNLASALGGNATGIAHGGYGVEVGGIKARQATEPTLGEDFGNASRAAVEAGQVLQIIEGVVHEVVFFGADDGVVAEPAERGAHQRPAALCQVRPLAR